MLDSDIEALSGDPTCGEPRYFSLIHDTPVVSSDIRIILRARIEAGLGIEVDHAAISHILHDGFVPQPRTAYRGVYSISTGVSARIEQGGPRFDLDFPFANAKSRQDSDPSPDTLLALLTEATADACQKRPHALLMLSSGLDSTSLALAAKEAGRDDVQCVTYVEANNHEEADFARDVCRRLGLRHETFLFNIGSDSIDRTLRRYAERSPEPCADPALTACVAPISQHSGEDTVVLDGSGSDTYFWKPVRKTDLIKLRLGVNRIPMLRQARRLLPMHLRYERLLATPLELLMFPGPWLRHCDTRAFYPNSVDTHKHWLEEFARFDYPVEELRSRVRSIFISPAAYMLKTRNAALAAGAITQFPWCDWAVADYCFNLPERHRFNRAPVKNKVIVRDMLRKYLDYNEDLIGKRAFSFGKRDFIAQHLPLCRDEVLNCSLWSPRIESRFKSLEKRFLRGQRTENALLALLMVSLWHNHWVRGSMVPTLMQRQPGGIAA